MTGSVNQLETMYACCRQAGGVEGIVNGMDTTDWSPNVDKFLDVKYDADTVDEGKALAKEALQAELGLPVSSPIQPVLCMACQMDCGRFWDSAWTMTLLQSVKHVHRCRLIDRAETLAVHAVSWL